MAILLQEVSTLQPLFAPSRRNGQYVLDRSQLSPLPTESNIVIPLVVDTEFWSIPKHWTEGRYEGRLGITTQIKGIGKDTEGVIFVHPECKDLITRHPVAASGFHPTDYLKHQGFNVSIERVDKVEKGLPIAQFSLYAHFALAEAMMIVKDGFRDDFDELMKANIKANKPRFEMQRRLRAVTPGKRGESDSVLMPWVMTLEGIKYQVSVCWVDTGAIHGMASYKDVCEAAGITLDAKDNFTSAEKGRMLDMAINRAEDFDAYALGDLMVYEVLEANAENFRKIYAALGIEHRYQEPKLTIGSTVRDLFLSALQEHLGADDETFKWVEKELLEPASAGYLRRNSQATSALLAKVEGGRCRNNRPTHTRLIAEILVDLDIGGCYGEGQRNQLYFVGKPEVISYPANSAHNEYMTLRTFLDGGRLSNGQRFPGLRDELVSGAWFARVTSSEPLKLAQDFFASWFVNGKAAEDLLVKYVGKMRSDSERVDSDESAFNEEDGGLKIFNHDILNATLTHDGLQWIDHVCSSQQRKELYDKLLVKAAVYYPKSKQCTTFEELLEAHKVHTGKNVVTRKGKGKKARNSFEDGECHGWYGVNIGELVIDDLIANRKLYDKKTPLNTLFKLCINTLYGDMTSKFFTSANVVVGNNITARARALAWYMEKGLFGFQTITDGCAFQLNRVVYSKYDKRRLTSTDYVNLYRTATDGNGNVRCGALTGNVILGSVGSVDQIEGVWVKENDKNVLVLTHAHNDGSQTIYRGAEAMDWVNSAAMEHLQMLFPNVDVLNADSTSLKPFKNEDGTAGKRYIPRKGQFEFEAKDYYDSGVFHGTANYLLTNPNGSNLKMRAYETKKRHESVSPELGVSDRYGDKNNPAKDFISQLASDPTKIERQVPFVKEAILKVSDYKNRLETWSALGLVPGDSFYKSGLLREFSLSQFTFKTLEQYQAWDKAIFRNKDKFGQSIELFFINEDGTLNYQKMVETVDQLIADDCMNPFEALDPNNNIVRKLGDVAAKEHPSFQTWQSVREKLGTPEQTLDDSFNS